MATYESVESRYFVCDYCGHVETASVWDDKHASKCESCRMPLDTRVTFDTLDNAERYSQAVADYHRE